MINMIHHATFQRHVVEPRCQRLARPFRRDHSGCQRSGCQRPATNENTYCSNVWHHNPTEHLCFRSVFNRFPLNTCAFLMFSIGSHGEPMFSFCFPQVPTERLCFPIVFHRFRRKTYVLKCFPFVQTENMCVSYSFL